ncbi:hypothetical protein C3Y87_05495 [Carbonactinospora thermoautotrophica]|nr:hypothetical protein [Carbonactinospora thermoautotrophica]
MRAVTMTRLRPVVLFVWGLTAEDVAKAEANARDEAWWRSWQIVKVLGPVVGGVASVANRGGYATRQPLASRADYGQVWEFYEPHTDDPH